MVRRLKPGPRGGVGQWVRGDCCDSGRRPVGRGRDGGWQGEGKLLNPHRVSPLAGQRSAQLREEEAQAPEGLGFLRLEAPSKTYRPLSSTSKVVFKVIGWVHSVND